MNRLRHCGRLLLLCGPLALSGCTGDADPIADVADFVGARRIAVPRFSGPFEYAPCDPVPSEGRLVEGLLCSDRLDQFDERVGQISATLTAESAAGSGSARHAEAVWNALWLDPSGLDESIARLEAVARAAPDNAGAWSDLAGAHLLRAETSQDPLDLTRGLEATDRALEADSLHAAVLHNRALALELLTLDAAAKAAWELFLTVESEPQWQAEARRRVERLQAPVETWSLARVGLLEAAASGDSITVDAIVGEFPGPAFTFATETALPAWAEAILRGAEGRAHLVVASAIGSSLARVAGDRLLEDAVARIESAGLDSPSVVRELATGHRTVVRGLPDFSIDEALAAFRATGSPMIEFAAYERTLNAFLEMQYDDVIREASDVVDRSALRSYGFLQLRAWRLIGLTHEVRADMDSGFAARVEQLALARALGDRDAVATALTDHGHMSASLVGPEVVWGGLFEALLLRRQSGADARAGGFAAVGDAGQIGLAPQTILLFRDAAVAFARETGVFLWPSLVTRAALLAELGLTELARADIAEARALAEVVPDNLGGADMVHELRLVEAQAEGYPATEAAIAGLAEAVGHYEATEYEYKLARAQLARARTFLRGGDHVRADSMFSAAIARLEETRASVGDATQRASFMDSARGFFEEMVRFQISTGDAQEAFAYFERMRARSLLESESFSPPGHSGMVADEDLRGMLAPNVVLIAYASLGNDLYSWTMDQGGISLRLHPRSATDLAAQGTRLRGAIAASMPDVQSVAEDLYDGLIAPALEGRSSGGHLVILPDVWSHSVPFAALWNRGTARYLGEEWGITVAPSARLFVRMAMRFEEMAADANQAVLAVGDPSFDQSTFALGRIPFAAREARLVADSHAASSVLVAGEATPSAFADAVRQHDVIHFAGHAIARPDAPDRSFLLLAEEPGRSGALYASDIAALEMPRTRLVILSACQTSVGQISDTEGPASLARAFFTAGTPAVSTLR